MFSGSILLSKPQGYLALPAHSTLIFFILRHNQCNHTFECVFDYGIKIRQLNAFSINTKLVVNCYLRVVSRARLFGSGSGLELTKFLA